MAMDGERVSAGEDRRACERRARRVYVFREKRTGFDRRNDAECGAAAGVIRNTVLSLRDRPGKLWVLLAAVNVLNLFDFALTLNALAIGATEANPIMRSLLNVSPLWAGIFKVAAVLAATVLIWQFKRYRKALMTAVAMLVLFAGVFIYHICGLALFGF